MKKIYISEIRSFEIKHGTREMEQINGIVYFIGDSTALSELEDEKLYFERDIKRFTTKTLESKKSFIMASNYDFDTNLLPYTNISSCLEIKDYHSIYCFLQDDVMKEIVYKLLSYAEENENYINDIPEAEILKHIAVNQKKQKKKWINYNDPQILLSEYSYYLKKIFSHFWCFFL